MPKYVVDTESFQRRSPNRKFVEASDPVRAAKAASTRNSGAVAVHDADSGALVWHERLGRVDQAHPAEVGYGDAKRTLPVWSKAEFVAYLDAHPDAGVFAEYRVAHVTRDKDSGQSQDRVAVVSFADVFDLVRDGRLRMTPVLFQRYWMYEQARDGEADGVLFPTSVPTVMRYGDTPFYSRVSASV